MPKREIPEINASSLADIAFLLLTFFLVATTLNKPVGLYQKLPDPDLQNLTPPSEVEKQNILMISIDNDNTIKIRDEVVLVNEIKSEVIKHVDNGRKRCDYCNGKKLLDYADNPQKAVVQLLRTNLSKDFICDKVRSK